MSNSPDTKSLYYGKKDLIGTGQKFLKRITKGLCLRMTKLKKKNLIFYIILIFGYIPMVNFFKNLHDCTCLHIVSLALPLLCTPYKTGFDGKLAWFLLLCVLLLTKISFTCMAYVLLYLTSPSLRHLV